MKEEWQKEMENAMDGAFVKEFTGEMDRVRKEWSNGRRHWYLVSALASELRKMKGGRTTRTDLGSDALSFLRPFFDHLQKFLFVDPARNGLGIGSQLLDWGVKQAEAERLPCWLEATDSVSSGRVASVPGRRRARLQFPAEAFTLTRCPLRARFRAACSMTDEAGRL